MVCSVCGGGFAAADGAAAQGSIKPAPPGTFTTVNAGPGDHTDPHSSGNLVSYSNSDGTNFTVRYFDLATKTDHGVPNSGTFDFLADARGSTIVFTRVSASASSIYKFDTSTAGTPSEVNPAPGVSRQAAQIGNNVIAYQDFCSGNSAAIIAYDTSTGTATNVSSCTFLSQSPAISPDGTAITWVKCATISSPCDVSSATKSGTAWVTHQITHGNGNCSHPDTNGQVVVYSCNRGTGDHLYWQPVAGGTEQIISNVLAQESSPSIAGQFVSFSGLQTGTSTNHDIYILDISTSPLSLYQITSGGGDNQLNDISITSDGKVNVVWQVQQASFSMHAYTFNVAVADLAIQKYAFPSTVQVGQGIAYGLVVHNLGPNTATDVLVTAPLPANTVFVGAIPSQGSCTGPAVGSAGSVSCNLGNIINGSYAAVGIAVKVTGGAGTTITNTATVGASTFDPTPKDNSVSVSRTVAQASPDD